MKHWLMLGSLLSTLVLAAFFAGPVSTAAPTTFDCSQVTTIPQSECEGLVALYNRTDGPNWTKKSGWLVESDPCVWYGVNCSWEGHYVIYITLSSNQLSGSIPAALARSDRQA